MATDADGTKVISTQYEGSVIEETGLIKMDFLGLKTLSIIKEALANIKHTRGFDLDIEKIPLDDAPTFKLYCEGRTTSTFQFESEGMQNSLRELKPSKFEDLIAMNALYRPVPWIISLRLSSESMERSLFPMISLSWRNILRRPMESLFIKSR